MTRRAIIPLLFVLLALFLLACEQRQALVPSAPATLTSRGEESPTPAPRDTLEEARAAARVGEWERAIVLYESLRVEPALAATALLELGDLYLADGQALAAGAAWQLALARVEEGSEQEAAIRFRLGRGYAALDQHEEALRQWQRVDELTDAADGALAQRMADSYEALGEPDREVEQAVRVYEHPGSDRVSRALAARRVGDHRADAGRADDALLWYERALELSQVESFRAELIARMAERALELDDGGYAENQWHLLIDEYPGSPQALEAVRALEARGVATSLSRLVTLYVENGAWASAERTYDLMQQRAPDDPDVLRGRAEMLARAGRWAEAEATWQELLDEFDEAAPNLRATAWLGLARSQWAQGEESAAEQSVETLLDDYPDSDAAPRALWERAEQVRRAGGPLLDQVVAYERLTEQYPNAAESVEAHWMAGLLRYRAGQGAQALDHWGVLADMDDDNLGTHAAWWAGKAAAATGDTQVARRWWQRAARLAPASYPSLRAQAALEGRAWQPRAADPFVYPAPQADALDELATRLGVAVAELESARPSSALFAQGELLLAWNERQRAITHFLEAIRDSDDPLVLWAMATRLQTLEVSNMSQAAAFRLMDRLDLDAPQAPAALLALAYPLPFEVALRDAAAPYGIDPLLLAALVHRESAWEPAAASTAAARGLTQVIPDTGAWIAGRLGDDDYEFRRLDRPVVALRYGAYYLDYVLRQFDDNPWQALAAYNAGPGNAQRWIVEDDDLYVELVPFPETKLYLETVYERWWAYDRLYRPRSGSTR